MVLLAAFTAGLGGLALSAAAPAAPTLSAAAVASTTLLGDPHPVHSFVLPRALAQRATRSRLVAAKPGVKPVRVIKHRASVPVGPQWRRPSYAGVVSPFGMRWGRMHKGIDFGAGYNAPIYAIGDGIVVGAGYLSGESGYGQITLVAHPNGITSAYAHQARIFVQPGEHVKAGQLIGLVGSTGESTGAHLHFEIRTSTHGGQLNPVPWLRKHGVYV
jgi:murein DD-endopeptidase MepM/ murein hydrolase activator NlpD